MEIAPGNNGKVCVHYVYVGVKRVQVRLAGTNTTGWTGLAGPIMLEPRSVGGRRIRKWAFMSP